MEKRRKSVCACRYGAAHDTKYDKQTCKKNINLFNFLLTRNIKQHKKKLHKDLRLEMKEKEREKNWTVEKKWNDYDIKKRKSKDIKNLWC